MQLAQRQAGPYGLHRSPVAQLRRALVQAHASTTSQVDSIKQELLGVVSRTSRGVSTGPADLSLIQDAVAQLRRAGEGLETTGPAQSGTWELVWTSEKETLFILERAPLFGTQAGAVYQVIDTGKSSSSQGSYLQNVITFPPEGAFIVDSSLMVAGRQRVEFSFTAAKLKLPGGRALGLPPFGKGWFDNLYLDSDLRVSYDSRGDTLITRRVGAPHRFT
ncbi:hypothetical protein VOLCADRAFT_86811 [Volvox carteri f. nagariensis]|uniref:Plastid lipid-associated protein/fibrillin conserved domain-containing protein n=1 Tax=Volvox carteri f. nagariensis TaxID=3068 RepID=D8TJN7_VOLCA|nr:uncharacterized protein VOLCADRAFT_86811 [Volvox carteri f. nagariensis]EFJ52574.1 hypothetical protein VOLCADRAFT_86811 [Volvox carteri f. nagariensis]|eukprot:XP_002946647.1 hypothetical protein VOLCADRAFT_86811 [Volvox carteri f. nagariensis]